MSKHTSLSPTPWKLEKNPKGGAAGEWTIRDAGYNVPMVARVYRRADADLIAAAPDLLAACECALAATAGVRCGFCDAHGEERHQDFCPRDKIAAAIAKAKGEPCPK